MGNSWLLTHQFFCKIYVKWGKNGWEIQWKSNIIQGRSERCPVRFPLGPTCSRFSAMHGIGIGKPPVVNAEISGKWMIITIQSLGCLGSLGSLFSPNHWNVWTFFNGKFEIPRWKLWSSALYWLVWLPIFINQMGLLRLAIYYKMLGPIFHEWIDGYPPVSSNVVSWQIYTIDDTGE